MKTCLICGAQVDAAFPTCPHCGEASFVEVPTPTEFANPEPDTRPETPKAQKRRR